MKKSEIIKKQSKIIKLMDDRNKLHLGLIKVENKGLVMLKNLVQINLLKKELKAV